MLFVNRALHRYPELGARRMYLALVVVVTISLYYTLYVAGGVAPLLLAGLKLPFQAFVYILAAGNLAGAFASLFAGLADRFGRAQLVVWGLLIVGLLTLFVMPNVTTGIEWGIAFGVISFVEGVILVATPALIRDFSPQVGRATAMGFWTIGLVVFILAFLFLKELAPELRDQLMVSERDRALVELKAKGLDIAASLRNPWRQMLQVRSEE